MYLCTWVEAGSDQTELTGGEQGGEKDHGGHPGVGDPDGGFSRLQSAFQPGELYCLVLPGGTVPQCQANTAVLASPPGQPK